MQNFVSRKSSKSRKYSKTYWPAELSQPHVICIPKIFEDFFACRILLAANHQNRESTQSLFRMQNCLSRKSSISRKYSKSFRPQNCLSRKSSISRKYSKIFSPAEMSQQQIIGIPKMLKVFFACRIVLAANHQNPEKAQSLFRMQNCVSRKSSKSRKYSKTYWPAELSQPHVICIPKIFEDFFACRIVLAANHQNRESTQSLFRMQNCLSRKSSISRKDSKTFRPQNCLSHKSSISRKYSKIFSPAEMSQQQIIIIPKMLKVLFACRIVLDAIHQNPGNIQKLIGLLNCLSPMSSVYRNYSKTSSPAELSQPQIIKIAKVFKVFFACRIVLAANHQYPENTQRLFARRIVLAANHQYPGNIQRFFRLQNCLSSKSLISRKHSKSFLACRIVLAASHQNPGNVQRLIGLLNCLSPMTSVYRKYSKTSSPAELSQQQIINIPEIFENFFACRTVLAASHRFSPKYSKTSSPAEMSQPQIINVPKVLKVFFACRIVLAANHQYPENTQRLFARRIVLAANHQYPGNIQRLFRRQSCLSRKSSISRKCSKSSSPAEMS